MKIYKNLNIKKKHKNAIIAIGNFDGLHLGHKKVLNQARFKAKKENLKFGVITFEPIPNMFFNKSMEHHRINLIDQKIYYLKKIKIDFLIIINFNKSFSNISADNFIKKILIKKLNSKYIFVSRNFKFGKNRSGNTNTLKNFEKKHFFKTVITIPHQKSKKIISSSLIRKNIAKGNVRKVQNFLGRPWSIKGKVIPGKKRGRKIGFPTCNIEWKSYALPKLGVYTVLVQTKDFKKRGIANIGYRPTFNGKTLLLEVNIFGIKMNLYKKILKVSFIKFIRPEKKFKNISELKNQIKKDIIEAKK
ncbi:MAG: bifunctional riboflavin kinase/FAD synthetase [Pelagibacteraceae bacterium]|jgi:riboflavin kinase / FMN adenylyltransferase|nr:bifunctional riboflavin kinase/FAD synthetase [Pelagibacteraceae bacterium]